MSLFTPLHGEHLAAGARMVDFGGWDMPVHYGSQIDEHHAVRRDCGMFDVSHMTVVDLRGERATDFLRHLLANDVARLKKSGRALYTCMLNDEGGVIDDLIVYFQDPHWFRLVVNAATRDKDLAWIRQVATSFDVSVAERRELAMIAVQGPRARSCVASLLGGSQAQQIKALGRFSAATIGDLFVARTGYTGEDGFEMLLPESEAVSWWRRLLDAQVTPCGLGARDTLRLEAGLNLYGQDMDETTTPAESNLDWTVALKPDERSFIGRQALEQQAVAGVARQLCGLVLSERGVLRHGQSVDCVVGSGQVTSGSYSPTLECSIGLARLPMLCPDRVRVDIRGRLLEARVVAPPFLKNGQSAI